MLFSDPKASPAETLVAELRDYPEWHRGRLRYGVWLALVEDRALLDYIRAAQERLADLLHPSPLRQPHLTVFVCGFEAPACVADDDFSPAQLLGQVERLERVRGPACTLPLGRPDSFASAAFLPVGDPLGRLARWREALGASVREVRQQAYCPHVTLGLYRRKVDAAAVRQRLAELGAPPASLAVAQLHYATYRADRMLGPLQSRRRLLLDAAENPPQAPVSSC
jgi:hypothetical protein